jgi:hypothetical protein
MLKITEHIIKYKNAYCLFYDIAMLFLALLCDMFLIVCLVYFIEMVGNSRK